MLTEDKITEIFVMADEFCRVFDAMLRRRGLSAAHKPGKRNNHSDCRMSKTEIIVIMILFHSSNHKCLKYFYLEEICVRYRHLFQHSVSYGRFTELEKTVVVEFIIFVKKCLLGKCTGFSFVDSILLRVCRNQRIHMHKVFKDLAQRGKCSLGWFYGFKLHLICNDKGKILNFMITPGDIDDREPLKIKSFVEFIYGKLVELTLFKCKVTHFRLHTAYSAENSCLSRIKLGNQAIKQLSPNYGREIGCFALKK